MAQCLAGRRACPPEDCGGIGGYADVLDQLAEADESDSEPAEDDFWGWELIDFDPERFDLAETNQSLRAEEERDFVDNAYFFWIRCQGGQFSIYHSW